MLREIIKLRNNNNFKIIPSIRFEFYLSLLKNSDFIIGNSSSGVREAPALCVNSINLGNRQKIGHKVNTSRILILNQT